MIKSSVKASAAGRGFPISVDEVRTAISEANGASINSALSRLTSENKIIRIGRGKYTLAGATVAQENPTNEEAAA